MSFNKTVDVLSQVAAERGNQDAIWGGPEHDDGHTPADWRRFIECQALKAAQPGEFRQRMIEVAALAVAAVESYDRKEAAR